MTSLARWALILCLLPFLLVGFIAAAFKRCYEVADDILGGWIR